MDLVETLEGGARCRKMGAEHGQVGLQVLQPIFQRFSGFCVVLRVHAELADEVVPDLLPVPVPLVNGHEDFPVGGQVVSLWAVG